MVGGRRGKYRGAVISILIILWLGAFNDVSGLCLLVIDKVLII